MKVSIVADDNCVYVEGYPEIVDLSFLDPEIHAVQWYGDFGEVEYQYDAVENTRKPNKRIEDFSPYQRAVDLWELEANKSPPVLTPQKSGGSIRVIAE